MFLDFAQLRHRANQSLEHAHKPGRMILIHTGIVMLVSLILTALNYLLDQQISTTGGLSGMGTRSILTTIQTLFLLAQIILVPFWESGYTYYALRVAKGESKGFSDLPEGFRRFTPILRLKILMLLMMGILIFVCSYASSFIFVLTPWAAPMMEKIELMSYTAMSEEAILETATLMIQDAMLPILLIFGLCLLVGSFLLFFRFRFAEMWLLDHPNGRAREALRNSKDCMRYRWMAMLRIDFRFWWFYLLEILVTALGYGDVILDAFGIEMTTNAFGTYMLFTSLYVWAQMALYWWRRNQVSVTYAHAYLDLCPEEVKEEEPVIA